MGGKVDAERSARHNPAGSVPEVRLMAQPLRRSLAGAALLLLAQVSAAQTTPQPAPPRAPPPARRDPFEGADLAPKPALQPLSPSDEQRRFLLPPGYHMEPVLT